MVQKVVQKYLHRRGDRYYFRWVFPADLRQITGKSEIKKSLHCSEFSQAVRFSGQLHTQVLLIQGLRQMYLSANLPLVEYRQAVTRHLGMIYPVSTEISAVGMEQLSVAPSEPTGMLFSELFEEFISHKCDPLIAQQEQRRPLSLKQQNEHRRHKDNIVAVMGDIPIDAITRQIAKNALIACAALPKKNLKRYRSLAVVELFELEIPEQDRIQPKTHLGIKKTFQGIMRFAVEKDYLAISPLEGLRLRSSIQKTFSSFTDLEVRKIFLEVQREHKSWKKWIVMLAAYTGARRGELVQLRKQDVKFDQETGRHYLLVTEDAGNIKTVNSNRQIPIHMQLINHGFMEFVDNSKSNCIFGDLTPQAVTRWFTAFKNKLQIASFDDYGNRKVFHSFRHTFVTKARGAGISVDHVQQVVGHEKIKTGVTDRYTHSQPLKIVLPVVDSIKYN